MYLIDDNNYGEVVEATAYRTDGVCGCLPRAKPVGECLQAVPFAEQVPLIPQGEWLDRIKAMEASHAWVNDQRRAVSAERGKSVVKNQGNLGYCHVFALANCMEAVRYQAGLEYIELAPESMGGVVNWRNQGGNMDTDIEWAAKHGCAARSFCPYLLHTPSQFKTGWDKNALEHVPIEWYELGRQNMWAETVTALLLGYPIYPGFDWWGHSVMGGKLVVVGSEICLEIENSWEPSWGDQGYGVLKGTKKIPSIGCGCFAPRVITWSQA